MSRRNTGFVRRASTLIEPLVVIAIPAAILFPLFAQARGAALSTQVLSNVKQVGTATNLNLNDHLDIAERDRP